MISIVDIPTEALSYRFVRARGPGGQHVNKVSSAVELRVDVNRAGLPREVTRRLLTLAGRRATGDGEIIIHADESRSQTRNREAALARFAALLAQAQKKLAPRVPTRPSRAAKVRRVDNKTRRGKTKQLRQRPNEEN